MVTTGGGVNNDSAIRNVFIGEIVYGGTFYPKLFC